MSLGINFTWNNQNKVKVVTVFENLPKKLFLMNSDDLRRLQNLEISIPSRNPEILDKIKKIHEDNPKSLYSAITYFQALRSFQFFDEAKKLFEKIKKRFPQEVLTRCIEGHYLLEDNKNEKFLNLLSNQEVLKEAFPERKFYHFKEALCFHSGWLLYFNLTKNPLEAAKHEQIVILILNTLHSFARAFKPLDQKIIPFSNL